MELVIYWENDFCVFCDDNVLQICEPTIKIEKYQHSDSRFFIILKHELYGNLVTLVSWCIWRWWCINVRIYRSAEFTTAYWCLVSDCDFVWMLHALSVFLCCIHPANCFVSIVGAHIIIQIHFYTLFSLLIIGICLYHNASLTWIYGKCFQGPCPHCQPITDWCWFGILVGADLLPSSGLTLFSLLTHDRLTLVWNSCRSWSAALFWVDLLLIVNPWPTGVGFEFL